MNIVQYFCSRIHLRLQESEANVSLRAFVGIRDFVYAELSENKNIG